MERSREKFVSIIPELLKSWHNDLMYRFYASWNKLHKRRGDYVDYHDYGDPIPNSLPGSLHLTYERDSFRAQGNRNRVVQNYGDRFSLLDSDCKRKPSGNLQSWKIQETIVKRHSIKEIDIFWNRESVMSIWIIAI